MKNKKQLSVMNGLTCTHISERTWILTFDDNISILLIRGKNHTFICDTHLGPESMSGVLEVLSSLPHAENLIIFNSHSDWDHIWGNCAFSDTLIIGHHTCRKRMQERGAFDLSRNLFLTRGPVTLQFPNLTFESGLCFEDDEVEFIYAPGHTIDSSICFDRKEKILYIGDLVEVPIPYIDYDQTDLYIRTLEMLLTFPADVIVSAHSGIISRDLVRSNRTYIRSVQEGIEVDTQSFGSYKTVHQANLNTLLMFRYEAIARQKLNERFDYAAFWSIIPDMSQIETQDLENLLTRYLLEMPG